MPTQVDVQQRLRLVQDAVVTVAARDGFGQVSLRRVAAEAGASTSVITHYVPSRDHLVRSTIHREVSHRQRLLQDATTARPARAALRALLEAAVLGTDERSHRFWLAIVLGANADPLLREELDSFNTWWHNLVRSLLGDMDPAPQNPQGMLDAIAVITDGMIINRFEQKSEWSIRRCRQVLDRLLDPCLA